MFLTYVGPLDGYRTLSKSTLQPTVFIGHVNIRRWRLHVEGTKISRQRRIACKFESVERQHRVTTE
jgi:hypothetical protein